MKARTVLPERVLEAATEIHLSLTETNFYVEECQVIVNEYDTIEFIGQKLLPSYFKTGEPKIDNLETFLRDLIAFTVLESLRAKGLIDSIDVDDKEIYFATRFAKEIISEHQAFSTKKVA